MRAYSAAHYLANREKRLTQARAWQTENRDKVAAAQARWRAKHPEAAVAQNAAFRAANPEYQREWAKAHPESVTTYQKAYQKDHPEKARDRAKRRRARLRGVHVEHVELAMLVERDGGYCGICHKPVAARERSIDHVLPLSYGGAHSYANTRLAHRGCNSARGNHGIAQLRMVG